MKQPAPSRAGWIIYHQEFIGAARLKIVTWFFEKQKYLKIKISVVDLAITEFAGLVTCCKDAEFYPSVSQNVGC